MDELEELKNHPLMKMSADKHAERQALLAEAKALEEAVWVQHQAEWAKLTDLHARAEALRLEGNMLDGAAREQVRENRRRRAAPHGVACRRRGARA
jgi:hypothetical protein